MTLTRIWIPTCLCLCLSGCVQGGPFFTVFGSYFPSWIASAVLGVLGALLVRVVLIRCGVDDELPLRALVYMVLAAGLTFLCSLLLFSR